MLQRGNSGDGCDLASTLCMYDLRKGNLFVLSWAMVRRVRLGSISSDLLMCGGGVRSMSEVISSFKSLRAGSQVVDLLLLFLCSD